jgi:molecular chaperone DnaK (HSP70)
MLRDVTEPIQQVVATVPAHYTSVQRDATQRAVQQATRCDKVRLLNEPTAAAVAYLDTHDAAETILVVDVGGGTTDVTLVQGHTVVRSQGTSAVGGASMTAKLKAHVLQEKLPCPTDYEALKKSLSVYDEVSGVTRRVYDELIRGDVEAICSIAGDVAEGYTVDTVVLCGGTTRTPLLQSRLRNIFKHVCTDMCPDTTVARGAALYARRDKVADVLTQPIGVRVRHDDVHVVVPANTPLPYKSTFHFKPMRSQQAHMALHLYQGDQPNASSNTRLGTWRTVSKHKFTVTIMVNRGGQVRVAHGSSVVVDGKATIAHPS